MLTDRELEHLRLASRQVAEAEERVNFLRERIRERAEAGLAVTGEKGLLDTFEETLLAMRTSLAIMQRIVREARPRPKGAAGIDACRAIVEPAMRRPSSEVPIVDPEPI